MTLALLFQLNLAEAGPGNNAPTDITLSNSTVLTTAGLNAVVGSLGAVDADVGASFTFSLVVGAGDTNNASFNISGSNLRCNNPLTLGVGTYSVRIQVSDGTDTYSKAFTVFVVLPGEGCASYGFLSFNDFFLRF